MRATGTSGLAMGLMAWFDVPVPPKKRHTGASSLATGRLPAPAVPVTGEAMYIRRQLAESCNELVGCVLGTDID